MRTRVNPGPHLRNRTSIAPRGLRAAYPLAWRWTSATQPDPQTSRLNGTR